MTRRQAQVFAALDVLALFWVAFAPVLFVTLAARASLMFATAIAS